MLQKGLFDNENTVCELRTASRSEAPPCRADPATQWGALSLSPGAPRTSPFAALASGLFTGPYLLPCAAPHRRHSSSPRLRPWGLKPPCPSTLGRVHGPWAVPAQDHPPRPATVWLGWVLSPDQAAACAGPKGGGTVTAEEEGSESSKRLETAWIRPQAAPGDLGRTQPPPTPESCRHQGSGDVVPSAQWTSGSPPGETPRVTGLRVCRRLAPQPSVRMLKGQGTAT